jgi:hypothetical protein
LFKAFPSGFPPPAESGFPLQQHAKSLAHSEEQSLQLHSTAQFARAVVGSEDGGELVRFTGGKNCLRQRFESFGGEAASGAGLLERREVHVRGDVARSRVLQYVLTRGVAAVTHQCSRREAHRFLACEAVIDG